METHLIVSNDELLSWMPRIMQAEVVALDTETTGLDWQSDIIVGLSFSLDGNTGYYVPFAHRTGPQCSYLVVKYVIELVLRNPDLVKVFHNAKFDIHMMWSVFGIRAIHPYHDTTFMAFLDDNTAPKDLKSLSARFFGPELVNAETQKDALVSNFRLPHMSWLTPAEMSEYAALDAVMTFKLCEHYVRLGVAPIYGTELALIDSVIDMERVGVQIDRAFLGAAGDSIMERLPAAEAELNEIVGRELNPRSSQQVGTFLYGDLGLVPRKFTNRGHPSCDEASLLSYPKSQAIDLILEARTLSKTMSTYIRGIDNRLDSNNRLHCKFNQAGTDTGRFSSSKPNLQNIPREGRVPVSIRGAFVPSAGRFLAFIDYKQVEFYMFAHYANDPAMLALVQDGHDFHRATATAVFNKKLEDIIWEERKFAKQVNFGYIYGIGARALAEKLGTSVAVAKAFLRRYDLQFPGVKTYVSQCKDDYALMGYTENIFGRRRKIPFDKAYRAVNTLCQGTAADIVKRSMVDLRPLLRASATDMILTIHDELAFDIPFEEVAIIPEIVKIMQNYRMRVPIIAECDWSPISWGDKRPWKGIEEVERERSVSRKERGRGRVSSSALAQRDRPADRLLRDLRAGDQG